jgi:hypothetical protein
MYLKVLIAVLLLSACLVNAKNGGSKMKRLSDADILNIAASKYNLYHKKLDQIPPKFRGLPFSPDNVAIAFIELTGITNEFFAPGYVEHEDAPLPGFPSGYNYSVSEYVSGSVPFLAFAGLVRGDHTYSTSERTLLRSDDDAIYVRVGGPNTYTYEIVSVPRLNFTDFSPIVIDGVVQMNPARTGYITGERYQVWKGTCGKERIRNVWNCDEKDMEWLAIRTDTGNRAFVDIGPDFGIVRTRANPVMNTFLDLESDEFVPLIATDGSSASNKRSDEPLVSLPTYTVDGIEYGFNPDRFGSDVFA